MSSKNCDQRAREARGRALEHREARARELGAALEVEDAEGRPEIPVRLRREAEVARRAPRALDAVGRFVAAARHGGVRHVRDALLDGREHSVRLVGTLLEGVDLLLERLHLGERLGRGLPLDRRERVAAAAHVLELRDGVAALAVERDELLEARAGEAFGHLGEQALRVLAQELAW